MAYFECDKFTRETYVIDVRNRIDKKVLKTFMGLYGYGEERKMKLGDDYEEVQNKVSNIQYMLNTIL